MLSMAMRSGQLSAVKARRIMQQVKEKGLEHAADDIRATFMIDLNLSTTNPGQASAEALADEFEDIAMFREYTNQNGEMNGKT
jgi:PleD family two-component response regulator